MIKTKPVDTKVFLNKSHIYDTDFYCPYKDKNGLPDVTREIFEFCIDKNKIKLEPESQFLMTDITEQVVLRYLVLDVTDCKRHSKANRVRCLFKGLFN